MAQSNSHPEPTIPASSFSSQMETAPKISDSSNAPYMLRLSYLGQERGWLGLDDSGYCILVQEQNQAIKILDYPNAGIAYLQTEDGDYLSVSDHYHYVGKYGWSGATGWEFQGDNLLSKYSNAGLSIFSPENGYLYCNSEYTPVTVKKVF